MTEPDAIKAMTEREAYSEFVAALDTARSSFTDRLKAADDLYAVAVRKGGHGVKGWRERQETVAAADRLYGVGRLRAARAYLGARS